MTKVAIDINSFPKSAVTAVAAFLDYEYDEVIVTNKQKAEELLNALRDVYLTSFNFDLASGKISK